MKILAICMKCDRKFAPLSPLQMYCSAQCSAHARNHRYYLTLRGRCNKRAGQSRYFQAHREELYEKRRERFEGYVSRILQSRGEESLAIDHYNGRTVGLDELASLEAKRISRVQHDWHGRQQGDSNLGRYQYIFDFDGKPTLTLVGRF